MPPFMLMAMACHREQKTYTVIFDAQNSMTYRKLTKGETFYIYSPRDTVHLRSKADGWLPFMMDGQFAWSGDNPDLHCDGGCIYNEMALDSLK